MSAPNDGPKSLSTFLMVRMALASTSVVFLLIILGAYGTPLLLNLGMPKSWTSIVWMAGPIFGLFQPFYGAYSDVHRSRFGRRRPFIMAGTLAAVASVLMFAYSAEIGNVVSFGHGGKGMSVAVAVVSIITCNFSAAISITGSKAIVVDNTPFHQQKQAGAINAVVTGVVAIVTVFMGTIDWPGILGVTWASAHVKLMSWFACSCAITVAVITCLSVHEEPFAGPAHLHTVAVKDVAKRIKKAFKVLPAEVKLLCLIQFCWDANLYPIFHYSTTWVAQFYTGRHQPFVGDNIDEAQQFGTLGVGLSQVVALICTGITLTIVSRTKRSLGKPLMMFNYFGAGLVLLMTYFVVNSTTALIVLALTGIPFGCGAWVAGSMVGEHASHAEAQYQLNHVMDPTPALPGTEDVVRPEIRVSLLPPDTADTVTITNASDDETETPDPLTAPVSTSGEAQFDGGNVMSSGVLLGLATLSGNVGQLSMALISGYIFRSLELPEPDIPEGGELPPPEGMIAGDAHDSIGWILRLSAVFSILAGLLSFRVRELKSHHHYAEVPQVIPDEEGAIAEDVEKKRVEDEHKAQIAASSSSSTLST